MEIFVTIVNGCLAFVTESCVSNVAGFQDLISGIAVNDHDQAADMTFFPLLHKFWFGIEMVVAHIMERRLYYIFDIIYSQHLTYSRSHPYVFCSLALLVLLLSLYLFLFRRCLSVPSAILV